MNKIYPFKFLDAYSAKDTNLFFGRDEEINDLYTMIFQSNILMVYGASGTGKTSLIQCGLAGRFQPHDWLALYIRRGSDLNDSFDAAIEEAGGTGAADLDESFKAIYRNSFRPIYLIFDQLEELFILGTKEEQVKFIQTVKAILNIEQPVKMIFSMREEYIGRLFDFEKEVPQLMRKKLRVEPMNLDKVSQVIIKATTLKGSNVSLKKGEEQAITETIFDKVLGSDSTGVIQLPYLQVFLDKLYMETTHDSDHMAEAVFAMDTINKMGDIGDILRDFLEEQVTAICQELGTDKTRVSTDEIWKILSPFATLDGTKDPIAMQDLWERLPDMDKDLVSGTVRAFVARRILRHTQEGDIYELVHDALAGKIAGKRTSEEITLLEVKKMLNGYIELNKETTDVLSEKQLNYVLPFLGKLTLTPAEKELVSESRKKLKERKNKDKRRFMYILSGMAVALIIMAGLTFWAIKKKSLSQSLALSGLSYYEQYKYGDVTTGFRYAQYAIEKDPGNVDAKRGIYMAVFPGGSASEHVFYKFSIKQQALNYSAAFSPDGKKIVTASADSTAKIWDAATGEKLVTLNGGGGYAYTAVFSPDGKTVLTASADSTAQIWDTATGKVIMEFKGHTAAVKAAVFSPNGKTVLTRSLDRTIRIWNASSGKQLAVLPHTGIINSAVFSPGGKAVLTASADDTARIWDIATGNVVKLAGHTKAVNFAVFSPDGKTIATASNDNTAIIWDAGGGKKWMLPHGYLVNYVSFSPDGRKVVTASSDKLAKIWDVASGACLQTLSGHTGYVNTAVFSQDGKSVLTSSADHAAKIWDAAAGTETATLSGHTRAVYSAVFSPDGINMLTASDDRTVNVWDIAIGRELYKLLGADDTNHYFHPRHSDYTVFSPDNKKVVTIGHDSAARIWDVASGRLLSTLKGHNGALFSAVFSPDGARVLTASADSTAKIWDTAGGNPLVTLNAHTGQVYTAFFSPDGKEALTTSGDTVVVIWDAAAGLPKHILAGHTGRINSAVFSPDGTKVVTASNDKTAIIWDAATGKPLRTLKGHTGGVYSAVFSPDSKKVVTASQDFTAMIWNAAKGDSIVLRGHTDWVATAAFSPDGTKVITASQDNTARIWNAANGMNLSELTGHTDFVHTAFFSPDGKTVVTASGDHSTGLWDAATGKELVMLPAKGLIYAASFSPDSKLVFSVSDDHSSQLWLISIPGIINDMDNKIEDLGAPEKAEYDIGTKNVVK